MSSINIVKLGAATVILFT